MSSVQIGFLLLFLISAFGFITLLIDGLRAQNTVHKAPKSNRPPRDVNDIK